MSLILIDKDLPSLHDCSKVCVSNFTQLFILTCVVIHAHFVLRCYLLNDASHDRISTQLMACVERQDNGDRC